MNKILKGFLLCIILYFVISNIAIFVYAKAEPEANADTMIILGAKVLGDPASPSKTLQERLDTAIIYLEKNPQTKVIVCGGKGKDEPATEASVMQDYLVKHGIAITRIVLEDKSTRTAQQFIYSKKLMPLGRAVVVTSDFHMLRSIMLAKRSGVNNISSLPATVALDNPEKLMALWREPLALLNSFLFDRINSQK